MALSSLDGDRGSRRILLVEDDPNNALTLSTLLEELGCAVDIAISLAAAREQLARHHYAVALLDHNLGDGKGTELLPLLAAASTPAILLSGDIESVSEQERFAAIHQKGGDVDALLTALTCLLAAEP